MRVFLSVRQSIGRLPSNVMQRAVRTFLPMFTSPIVPLHICKGLHLTLLTSISCFTLLDRQLTIWCSPFPRQASLHVFVNCQIHAQKTQILCQKLKILRVQVLSPCTKDRNTTKCKLQDTSLTELHQSLLKCLTVCIGSLLNSTNKRKAVDASFFGQQLLII